MCALLWLELLWLFFHSSAVLCSLLATPTVCLLAVSALIAINFAWNRSIFGIEMLTWCGVCWCASIQ